MRNWVLLDFIGLNFKDSKQYETHEWCFLATHLFDHSADFTSGTQFVLDLTSVLVTYDHSGGPMSGQINF